jgi:hypothetical protein
MEPTTEIAAFNTRLEADLVVAKLAEAGIDALIVADNLGGTFPMMQMITGGYKVMVLEAMAAEAREIAGADEDVTAVGHGSGRSAIFRFLAKLSPTQILGVLILLAASIAATLYAVTQGTL